MSTFTSKGGPNLIYKGGSLHKVLTSGGYVETSDSTQPLLTTPAYRFFLTDHLGSVRVVVDAAGNVLQRNDYLPYGDDYIATYAPGGDILAGLNIPIIFEGEDPDEPEDDPESGNRGNRNPEEPIGEGEEDDVYHSFNPYKFSGKEQIRSLYDFGARWFTPKRAHWTTMDPLAEKYFSISPYAYCAGNPINLVDPEGRDVWEIHRDGRVIQKEKSEEHILYAVDAYGSRGDFMNFSSEDILLKLKKDNIIKETRSINFGADKESVENAIGLFLFLADNTSFEWAVHIGKDNTVLGTKYNETAAGYWGDYGLMDVPETSIHSHPGKYGSKYENFGEVDDLRGDFDRMKEHPELKADNYYIYYPNSKTTYSIMKKPLQITEPRNGLEKYRKKKI